MFAANLPQPDPKQANVKTDAIIVLTGGGGRLAAGFDLLARGRSDHLLISGVYRGVEIRELLTLWQHNQPAMEDQVSLGYEATNTIGNAVEGSAWMRHNGYHSLRLVTADYHMRRALRAFRHHLPNVTIIPHPVYAPELQRQLWWKDGNTFFLLVREYTKYLISIPTYPFQGTSITESNTFQTGDVP